MRTTKPVSEPMFLTPEQAAQKSGLGVNKIRQLMQDGEIAYLSIGNRKLTTAKDLLDYYEKAKNPAS